jgi:hypothetical protein
MAARVGAIRFDGAASISRFRSSDWAERAFCRTCGTHLFYHLTAADQHIVWIGTFDDLTPFQLESEIFIDEKPQGYAFAGDHPRLTGAEFLASLSGD